MLSETDGSEVSLEVSEVSEDVVSETDGRVASVVAGASFLHPQRAAAVTANNAAVSLTVILCKARSFQLSRKL